MNYIIWNGKNSKSISGLLISELPPITKPKMRTKTTTIDGRDGDIVDELGYESYSKKIKIGLYGKFNIDEIIKYFTGSGKIVFSNEEDKYYIASITKDIDYERLLRYRTATIEFHVQPFKYKYDEAPFIFNIRDEEIVKVSNVGLEDSKPILTIYGSGTVDLYINNSYVCQLDIQDEYITLDSFEEEAYKGTTLMNRYMNGKFPKLEPGINTIKLDGNVSKLIIEPKSRWL